MTVPQNGTVGITSNTESRMIFGAGALYRNYGNVGQQKIGATRGGSTFAVEREDRDVELDGIGNRDVKGLVRTLGTRVTLEVVLPEISDTTWADVLRGSTTTSGGKTETVPPNESAIASSEFYTNIALVAEVYSTGNEKAIILENALVFGEWDVQTENLGEAGLSIVFRAHYNNDELNSPPYRIGILSELLRDWSPEEDLSGQTLSERIYQKDGTLGSTTGADSNDPAWNTTPPALTFGEDDYVTESSTIWTTT